MPRIEIPFTGQSKQHRSLAAANQITRNWYPEVVKDDQGKDGVRILIGTPGRTLLADVSGSPLRGLHMTSNANKYWAVFGNAFYEFQSDHVPNLIGNLSTTQGPVYIADNGTHLLIVDGSGTGYVYEIASSTWTADLHAAAPNFVGGDHVVFLGGYFIVIQPGTNVLQACQAPYGTSPAGPATWNALSVFSTALSDAGPVIALGVLSDQLWAIGDYATVIFYNAGNPVGFPFSLIPGAPIPVGISARAALSRVGGSLMWPGKTRDGDRFIVAAQGYTPTPISTTEIDYALAKYPTVSDAFSYTYIEEGHEFYVITFPAGKQTWVFDAIIGEWHERSSYGLDTDRAFGHIFFNGQHIVGDYYSGKLYRQALGIYTDNGDPIIRTRRCQHLKSKGEPLEISELVIDAEAGVGLGGQGAGSQPQMVLRYSKDGGRTWSEELTAPMGKIGEYLMQVRFPRLGTANDWVFEIMVSDPVPTNILGAYAGV